ncbi:MULTISPECIES: Rrf2 family transcriptional regulator [Paenibacillus]|uniref:RrF2 family transcriptional regulator n=1 Tax=Paenibacillus TaxID=44249 RepID=UPI00020D76EA|nr:MULTISPECIES: Rrf2 family transcriptional regulator [Paenibacillus]EGL19253.1 transcriptional regulator, Rrf2 family [Paenibacillus sp. HGF7]EPD93641.1 Rrf2 family protein [Paenibacillus sp. HGH0039]MBV6716532.1 Rrf2 family transcriptional regulator [Paenibacillus chitinolyticus]
MQFSKSTGYALHALIHLAHTERGRNVGIKELSAWLGVSESYLSKIMSKLRQDGIVRAVPGASGGYELARETDQITFLDVIQVIEGRQHMYECFKISEEHHPMFFESEILEPESSDGTDHRECLVKKVMIGAERHMNDYLKGHTIQSVLDSASAGSGERIDKKS